MLNLLLKKLSDNENICKFVLSGIDLTYVENCISIDDARDAAFYAMGAAVKNQKAVVLVVDGDSLTNIYTAITEAWFQKANVIILSVFDEINKIKTSWMDRCVVASEVFLQSDEENCLEYINNSVGAYGPVLVNILAQKAECAPVNYNVLLDAVKDCDGKYELLLFNSADNVHIENADITVIPKEYRYGIISKYFGSAVAGSKKILCCTTDCLMLDLNVFRTRYKNSNMKIIAIEDNGFSKEKIENWIISNGYSLNEVSTLTSQAFKEFAESSQPSVLLIKE